MTDSKLLDSSVWLEYIINGKFRELVESGETLFLSILSVFEVRRKMIRMKYERKDLEKAMNFVKRRGLIIPITVEIVENATDISVDKKMPMADSIIYATALKHDAVVYTMDNHFRRLERVEMLG
jgi:toxin FitB